MSNDSGGLSREEFLRIQEQLIELRNRNYELQEELRRKNNEITQLSNNSPKNEALQFASKLINRNKDSNVQKYETEIDNLQKKLATQEEEFRLQQETLFAEINKITALNEELKRNNDVSENSDSINSKNISLQMELEKCRVKIEEFEQKTTTLQELLAAEQSKKLEQQSLINSLENKILEYRSKIEAFEQRNSESHQQKQQLVQTLKERISVLEEQLQLSRIELQNKARDYETMEREKNQQIEELNRHIEQVNDLIGQTQENVEKMTEQYETAQINNVKLEESTALLNKRCSELENRVTTLTDQSNKEIHQLREALENAKQQIAFLEENNSKKNEEESQHQIEAAVENALKEYKDQALLMENKFQLELSDARKEFAKEKAGLVKKISHLENNLSTKDDEKNLALKKQSALMKELQRSLKEERKRADSLEKKAEEKAGWHVVGQDCETRSSHTYDGNESISSLSALESDNVELINRLTTLQSIHAESVDRLNLLETENANLRREIHEKSELIEHWIKTRALPVQNNSPSKEGGLKKFFASALQTDESTHDIKEMNKKLQRMLEETLSKNIGLQRDIQTLLERTDM